MNNFGSTPVGPILRHFLCYLTLFVSASWEAPIAAQEYRPRSNTIRLISKLRTRGFGSHVVRFGDLNGDGQAEAIIVQINRKRKVTAITAFSLATGKIIWQHGKTRPRHFRTSGDIPVQVYDWNGDGFDDVIFARNGRLHIIDGSNGRYLRQIKIEDPYSLFILSTQLFDGKAALILQGRTFVSLLDPNLKLHWRQPNSFGHFPLEVDLDQDGEPELLSNYALFRSDGQRLWNRAELRGHNDSADYGDTNCNGQFELAIATSGPSALLDKDGAILWRGVEFHSQHTTVGSFLPKNCQKQIAVLDRDQKRTGILRLYDYQGKLLWSLGNLGTRPIMSRVDGWDEEASLLLIFRQDRNMPVLINGTGTVVGRFPFPPAQRSRGNKSSLGLHFAQHFDLTGNGREEVILYNEKAIWIYANASYNSSPAIQSASQRLPNPRIFNATFYQGMQ